MKTFLLLAAVCGTAFAAEVPKPGLMVATNPKLRAQALHETTVPVRPGVPGQQPFWNGRAVQFQYVPAFDFKEVPGAKSYRFTITPVKGELLSFTADKPWSPLSPVWEQLTTDKAKLTVQGVDEKGVAVGEPLTRAFHRTAVIAGEYPPAAMSWRDSARTALEALVHSPDLRCWFTTGVPDEQFPLYRYPSKIGGGSITGATTSTEPIIRSILTATANRRTLRRVTPCSCTKTFMASNKPARNWASPRERKSKRSSMTTLRD